MAHKRDDGGRALLTLCLLAGLLAAPTAALCLSTDRDQPMHIQADRVELDEKTGVSTYRGAVELSQGSLHLTADSLTVHRIGNKVERLVADGTPATFRQRPDNAVQDTHGQARHLEYRADDATIELSGQARLWNNGDEFSSARIVYDADQNRVRANGGESKDGRVHAIIHPRRKEGER